MQLDSKKVIEISRKLTREHPEYFEALLEFERTKKLPKLSYKERANFTLDADMLREFRTYCQKKGYKMSNVLEKLINKEINS